MADSANVGLTSSKGKQCLCLKEKVCCVYCCPVYLQLRPEGSSTNQYVGWGVGYDDLILLTESEAVGIILF